MKIFADPKGESSMASPWSKRIPNSFPFASLTFTSADAAATEKNRMILTVKANFFMIYLLTQRFCKTPRPEEELGTLY
jgi:hypothetical protein